MYDEGLLNRLLAKVQFTESCWLWTGYRDRYTDRCLLMSDPIVHSMKFALAPSPRDSRSIIYVESQRA